MLALSGCSKKEDIANIEQKISALGEITLDSKNQIDEIDILYNNLSKRDKTKVYNYSTFENAKITYKRLETAENQRIENERLSKEAIAEGLDYLAATNGKTRDVMAALECFERADCLDNIDGSFLAGYVYYYEMENQKFDYKKAIEYFKKCGDDYPLADAVLSHAYFNGNGVKADSDKAKEYLDKVRKEFDEDKYDLGDMMYCAHVVASVYPLAFSDEGNDDREKFVEWSNKAIDAGNSCSMYLMAIYYYSGVFEEKDIDKTLDLINRAYKLGNMDATLF